MQVISNMKTSYFLILLFFTGHCFSQPVTEKITAAFSKLEDDNQLAHASVGFYVVNSKTGQVVFNRNGQTGLAPASTLKVLTSVSAFELLGKDYTYKTSLFYDGVITGNVLNGDLLVKASGDPTLGSWRWKNTGQAFVTGKIIASLQEKNIKKINGYFLADTKNWETNHTPGGWTWEDIGNYYGAGAGPLNWHENQYDLILKPGSREGDSVKIVRTEPALRNAVLYNELRTGKPGSGDQSVIYLPENGMAGYVRGTVPAGVEIFTIKGAVPEADFFFLKSIEEKIEGSAIEIKGRTGLGEFADRKRSSLLKNNVPLLTLYSPPLDSINYWFLKESVNLFGEAFVKTIAFEKKGFGATDSGLAIIRHFWSTRGIEKSALKMMDGSGLSPANRITPHALVTVLQYAKKQDWFPSFNNALPVQNGIRMKSGYISGVRGYAGYVQSKGGEEYIFAFIINNFDGSPSAVREKMWKILDLLK